MSQSQGVLSEAKRIAAYVTALYGKEQFGVLRLLTGFEPFRAVEKRTDLYKLLGRTPMLSFEKVLREATGLVYLTKDGPDREFIITGPGGRRKFRDDKFSTVAGRLVQQIVAFNPELHSFKPSPLVQLGGGADIGVLCDLVNNEDMDAFIGGLPEQYTAHCTEWNNAKPVVDCHDSTAAQKIVAKAKMVSAVSSIFTMLRGDRDIEFPDKPGAPLPFARADESGSVFMGMARLSLQFPSTPTEQMKAMLKATHPDGVWEGENFIIRDTYDPFCLIGSSRLDSDLSEEVYLSLIGTGPAVVEPVISVAGPESSCGGHVVDAVRLVLEYVDANVAILTPDEQRICKYGSEAGEKLWERVSTQKRKLVLKSVPAGPHKPEAFIRFIADFITGSVSPRAVLHARDPYDLAAGRILACKGQIDFCSDEWAKK